MLGEIASLAAAALWAVASLLFTRLGRDDVSPLAMNLLKCVIAFGLLVLTLAALEGRVWPYELSWGKTAILAASGVAGLTIGDTAFFGSLTRIGSRRALLLRALAPPTTAVLAVPVLGEPLTFKMGAGMALTIGGVVWVIMERNPSPEGEDEASESSPGDRDESTVAPTSSTRNDETSGRSHDGFAREELVGFAFGVVAALLEAVGNILTKLGGGDIPALDISIVRLAFGILGLGAIVGSTSRMLEVVEPMRIPRKAWLIVVATFLGTYLGIWLSMAGIRYTYTGIASTLASTSPVWILPLAHFFEDERVSLRAVVGACIAVIGIGILFLKPSHFAVLGFG